MPSPTEPFEFCGNREYRRFVVLRRMKGLWFRRPRKIGSQRLKRLVEAVDADLALLPVRSRIAFRPMEPYYKELYEQ